MRVHARIERWLGMELFGSEDDPDWFVEEGSYDDDNYRVARLDLPQLRGPSPIPSALPPYVPPVGGEEKRRIARDQVIPEKRFHYRYLAADLAWKAAALMPDQQELTATVLAAGGRWLESVQEDKAADKFYQMLLRRCGHTETGREAQTKGALPDVQGEDF